MKTDNRLLHRFMQEAVFMFRRYCKSGLVIIGVGVGMLLACLLRLGTVCVLCGIALIILGTLLAKRL